MSIDASAEFTSTLEARLLRAWSSAIGTRPSLLTARQATFPRPIAGRGLASAEVLQMHMKILEERLGVSAVIGAESELDQLLETGKPFIFFPEEGFGRVPQGGLRWALTWESLRPSLHSRPRARL
eukprot:1091349-Pyramimonas_sp.AAC.1